MTKIAQSAGYSKLANFFKQVFNFFNPSNLFTQFNAFIMENLDFHIGFFIPS